MVDANTSGARGRTVSVRFPTPSITPRPPLRRRAQQLATAVAWSLTISLSWICALADVAEAQKPAPEKLDCATQPCSEVLPGAVKFESAGPGKPWLRGLAADGKVIGWVALSTDLVDIKAYSGKPMVTLFGLDSAGVIRGARVLHHSEPIILVGIPEKKLSDFLDLYAGMDVRMRVVFGRSNHPDVRSVDAISGATVTALAQNQTILEASRRVAAGEGLLAPPRRLKGHWVEEPKAWTFAQMRQAGAFGRLVVRDKEMNLPGATDGVFLDLWFTLADAPQIGLGLIPAGDYAHLKRNLKENEHILVVLGAGKTSFKGSGFVRGGLFDRIHLEQDMRTIVFADADYMPLKRAVAPDTPGFTEAAIFVVRAGRIDPGRKFEMAFVGSRYDGQGGFSREFRSFPSEHKTPRGLYALDEPEPKEEGAALSDDPPSWKMAWELGAERISLLTAILALVTLLFAARRFLTAYKRRTLRLHVLVMLTSFVVIGLWMRAQPSITQLLTLVDGIVGEWRQELFLSDPLLFITWNFIAVTTIIWGRGVFCGWICPYGAMHELTFKLGRLLRLPTLELPERWHLILRNLRYVILVGLVVTFLYDHELGERLAEIEPFKSTFFVAPWTRHAGLFAWWLLLLGSALFVFRPFCRYICPLGAALALPSWLRLAGPWRRNYCQSCTICTKTCEPRAIDAQGRIDPRECLNCMECEVNYRDVKTCPPLIALDRLSIAGGTPRTRKAVEAALQAAVDDKQRRALERARDWRPWPR